MCPRDSNNDVTVPSDQRYPWRAVARSTTVAIIALLPLLPQMADAADIDEIPAVAGFLAITMALSRVLALPAVDAWLQKFVPWLSSEEPYHGRHRK